MSRSKWKGYYINNQILSLINKSLNKNKFKHLFTKIWSRNSVISSKCLNWCVRIHRGNSFIPLVISEKMIGRKFGEFAYTRSRYLHPDNDPSKKKDKNNKKKIKKK